MRSLSLFFITILARSIILSSALPQATQPPQYCANDPTRLVGTPPTRRRSLDFASLGSSSHEKTHLDSSSLESSGLTTRVIAVFPRPPSLLWCSQIKPVYVAIRMIQKIPGSTCGALLEEAYMQAASYVNSRGDAWIGPGDFAVEHIYPLYTLRIEAGDSYGRHMKWSALAAAFEALINYMTFRDPGSVDVTIYDDVLEVGLMTLKIYFHTPQ